MGSPVGYRWQQPDPRGKALVLVGTLVALGFIVVIGLLMSAVAQSQVVRDPKEGGTPLDLRSVTIDHRDDAIVAKIKLHRPVKLGRLPGGSKLWVSLHPGGDAYYVMEMALGNGEASASVTPCDADACAYESSIAIPGRMTGPRRFRMVLPRAALPQLGDRLEWQAGSLHGSHRIDQAPDEGFKIHHL